LIELPFEIEVLFDKQFDEISIKEEAIWLMELMVDSVEVDDFD